MRVLVFGASGMLGQGAIRECIADADVTAIISIVRKPTGITDAKLREIVHADFSDFSALAADFTAIDACLFCLGVSSAGMSEADYKRITYDTTLAAAKVLVAASPQATFIYISGANTDSTEKGRTMWARVKGTTENALLALPFARAYMFRPGYIQPIHGEKSRTRWTRYSYNAFGWLYPVWRRLFPNFVTTTEALARSMLHAAKNGAPKPILEIRDFKALLLPAPSA